jgi:hypothetical protein
MDGGNFSHGNGMDPDTRFSFYLGPGFPRSKPELLGKHFSLFPGENHLGNKIRERSEEKSPDKKVIEKVHERIGLE